jgi:pyruvate/2-oxoglutarate dehydrogenase complex dihydrolipoamide dehydrogenase (E3) component
MAGHDDAHSLLVTFTDLEVASVGLSEAAARARGIDVVVASADPAETARGYIHDFHRGALKLIGDRERGVLLGATPAFNRVLGESLQQLAAKVA